MLFQLVALLTHGYQFPQLQLENFVKPVMLSGSRTEPQEAVNLRESGNSTKYAMPYRAVLLMTELGKCYIIEKKKKKNFLLKCKLL